MMFKRIVFLVVALLLIQEFCFCQTKEWDKDMVMTYKMKDKNQVNNTIEVKKDTIHYHWIEKNRVMDRTIVGNDVQIKILDLMEQFSFSRFKNKPQNESLSSITFIYKKGSVSKTIGMPQPLKNESNEERYIKGFLELIFMKVFEKEVNNYPK